MARVQNMPQRGTQHGGRREEVDAEDGTQRSRAPTDVLARVQAELAEQRGNGWGKRGASSANGNLWRNESWQGQPVSPGNSCLHLIAIARPIDFLGIFDILDKPSL